MQPNIAPLVLPISKPAPLKEGFSVNIIHKGPHLYEMVIQDPSHYLSCALRLKVEDRRNENEAANKIVVCYFPQIDDGPLKKFIERDATLYSMLTVQFQMKMLKLLFLFCADHCAFQLVIYMGDGQIEKFSTYASFLSHYAQPFPIDRQKPEILIPVNPEIFGKWIGFMDRRSEDFRQTLQKERRFNYIIRSYLEWDPHLQFFY